MLEDEREEDDAIAGLLHDAAEDASGRERLATFARALAGVSADIQHPRDPSTTSAAAMSSGSASSPAYGALAALFERRRPNLHARELSRSVIALSEAMLAAEGVPTLER